MPRMHNRIREAVEDPIVFTSGNSYRSHMTDGISIHPEVCHGKPVITGTRGQMPMRTARERSLTTAR